MSGLNKPIHVSHTTGGFLLLIPRFAVVATICLLGCTDTSASSQVPATSPQATDIKDFLTLACEYSVGTNAEYKARGPVTKGVREKLTLTFTSADWRSGSGMMSGNNGTGLVSVLGDGSNMTLVEELADGLFQVTVVYDILVAPNRFYSVHSRHSSMLKQVVPSQYYGYCSGTR